MSLARSQEEPERIPIGLESAPTGRDSFFPYLQFQRPRIVLAMSGGGARGLAQIGILKSLEKHGIPVDGVAGTSMGAIVGGLYAVGYSAGDIEMITQKIDWETIIEDAPPRQQLFMSQKEQRSPAIVSIRLRGLSFEIPSAFTSGQRLTSLITDLLLNAPYSPVSDFKNLHIPFCAVTTDLVTGKKVVLSTGSLTDAMRASMSIPLLFAPVPMDTALLVDGGLVQNLPVAEARSLNGDLVIALNTSSRLHERQSLDTPLEIVDQVTTIMQQNTLLSEREEADITIEPDLHEYSNTDFKDLDHLIRAGEEAAESAIPLLESFLSRMDPEISSREILIQNIEFAGLNLLNPDTLFMNIDLKAGGYVSYSQVVWAGRSLYQTGYFSTVNALYDSSDHRLIFQVKENPVIQDIVLSGNRVLSDSLLLGGLETVRNSVLNIHRGRHDIRSLLDQYHRRGYVLAGIDTVTIENGNLSIKIHEGQIGRISLTGNTTTRPFVVLREVPLKPGDLFNVNQLQQGLDNIFSTGYFENIRFDFHHRDHVFDLEVHIKERSYTLMRGSLRYDLERRTQGYIQIVRENILGYGIDGYLLGLLGKKDEKLEARLWTDRLWSSYTTFTLNFAYENRHFNYYAENELKGSYSTTIHSGSFILGQQMRRLGTLSLRLRPEWVDLKPMTGTGTPLEKFTLVNLTVRSEVDTRDRVPFTRSGKHHILEYEMALRFLGSDVSYTRIFSSMESYYPVLSSLLFCPRISWGTSDMTTPFIKQFHLGGLRSFMGLPEEFYTGKRYILLTGELQYTLPWPSWMESTLSIRYDLGGIWGRYSKISAEDFKHALGGIWSWNTPLGPVHIGYGRMNDGYSQWYFSAGYTF